MAGAGLWRGQYLEDHQDTADDAGVPVDHSLLHDVADAAEMLGLDGLLLAQEGPSWEAAATGRQHIELVDAHGTHMVQQLADHLARGHRLLC